MKSADLIIYGDIGYEVTAVGVSAELARMGAVDEIYIRINSFGGDAFDGMAIFQRLSEHRAKKIVHIDGIAASAASVIAMAGDEIMIARGGFFIIHDAWIGVVGNAAKLRAAADRSDALSGQMAGIYVRKSGASMDEVRAWMAEEKWFDSENAVAAGFATSIVETERMAAKFDPARHHFRENPARIIASPKRDVAALTLARMKMHLRSAGHRRR